MKNITFDLSKIFQFLKNQGIFYIDIFHSTDMSRRSKLLRIPIGPLLYQFQSKPNQNRGQNPIFSPPIFTKSKITLFSFCAGFQALSISFMWPKNRRNPLTERLHNSCNQIQPSGQVCTVLKAKNLQLLKGFIDNSFVSWDTM